MLAGLQVAEQRLARRCIMGVARRQFISDWQTVLIDKRMNFRS
jgi:hypothetical protein